MLVKKPDAVDPLDHPWVFLAEASRGGGADRVKLQSRAGPHPARGEASSGLAVVAYWLSPDDSGDSQDLLRWSSPVLPQQLDREFPRRDAEGVQVLAERVDDFAMRFLDDEGNWVEEWDSSTLARSSQLPIGAELRVTLLPEDAEVAAPGELERRVWIPVRPLDLVAALQTDAGEGEEGEDDEEDAADDAGCTTVAQCRAQNPALFEGFLGSLPDPAQLEAILDSLADQCFSDHAASFGVDVAGCE